MFEIDCNLVEENAIYLSYMKGREACHGLIKPFLEPFRRCGTSYKADERVAEPSGKLGQHATLMVVEDDRNVAELFAHVAEKCGCTPIIACSCAEADRICPTALPSVVLLDLSLPDDDGVQLLHHFAAQKCAAAIVIISGHDRRVVEAAKRCGQALGLCITDCLLKPVRPQHLVDAIGHALAEANNGCSKEGYCVHPEG